MSSHSTGILTRFEVQSVQKQKGKQERVNLTAVYSSDEKPENKVFSKFTPWGEIAIQINNPDALDVFEPGDEFEVIFRKIPEKPEPIAEA